MCNPDIQYPPLVHVVGVGTPTFMSMIRHGPKSFKGWDCESGFKPDGDGRVPSIKTVLPDGVPYQLVLTKKEHPFLLNGPRVKGILENLILGEPIERMKDKMMKAAL